MFSTKFVDGVYVNTAETTYTFAGIVEYVRNNIQLWEKHNLIWDLTQFPLSKDAEPSELINQQISPKRDLAMRRAGKKTAFVVPQDFAYGMFRMYCVYSEHFDFPVKMAAFRSLEDAKLWIEGDTKG